MDDLTAALTDLDALPGPVAARVARAVRVIEARLLIVEAALAGLAGRRGPTPPNAPRSGGIGLTLFGIPVRLVADVDTDAVRAAIDALPAGLSSEAVIELLERDGLLRRVEP